MADNPTVLGIQRVINRLSRHCKNAHNDIVVGLLFHVLSRCVDNCSSDIVYRCEHHFVLLTNDLFVSVLINNYITATHHHLVRTKRIINSVDNRQPVV